MEIQIEMVGHEPISAVRSSLSGRATVRRQVLASFPGSMFPPQRSMPSFMNAGMPLPGMPGPSMMPGMMPSTMPGMMPSSMPGMMPHMPHVPGPMGGMPMAPAGLALSQGMPPAAMQGMQMQVAMPPPSHMNMPNLHPFALMPEAVSVSTGLCLVSLIVPKIVKVTVPCRNHLATDFRMVFGC